MTAQSMQYRIIRREDTVRVASLHQDNLPGFLSQLGTSFLNRFYLILLQLPDVFTVVAIQRGKVVGFSTGVTRINGLLATVILRDPLWFFFFFVKYFSTHPFHVVTVIQTLMYPGFSGKSAELLSLAVDPAYRGQGIGRDLFLSIAKEMKRRGIAAFEVSAYDRLPANGFYLRLGCRLERSFSFLGETMHYYRYDLETSP